MKTDIEIANSAKMKPIQEIANILGIDDEIIELYGKYKAKLPLSLLKNDEIHKSKLILVSAITPTPAGEGKTTTSIGLVQALNRLGKKATAVLREPSLGPVFGMKGGAAGGGYSQVLPMEDINLHFTGDFSAIEKAHNLLVAIVDNHIQHRKGYLDIDPRTIHLRRVMDMNDRALRNIVIGLGGKTHGIPRETGFDISAASEVMAILCLSENFSDLKERLNSIFVGFTYNNEPIYAKELKVAGAMSALLKDAIKPNLVQTLEGNPAIIHGGPFANIAQGTNSVIATKMAMAYSDYAVTEAGFGFDLGAEKFFDIKCKSAGLSPSAAVLVATVRALKLHGGVALKDIAKPDPKAVEKGLVNLEKHVDSMMQFNLCPVIAVNKFYTDTEEELALILQRAKELGIGCAVSDVWGEGGNGALELGELVINAAEKCISDFKPLYDWNWSVKKKIETIAKKMYGAEAVDYLNHAKRDLRKIKKLGLEDLPVCMAKTQNSLSDNPKLLGRPRDFIVTVREIQVASGAGFLIPITGDIVRMPGLPRHPAAETIDIDNEGNITGIL